MRQIVSPLDGFGSPFGPQRGFNPRKLFAAGEQGAWYDPSDLTTLFTDTAGTTQAADTDPVGLWIDRLQSPDTASMYRGLDLTPDYWIDAASGNDANAGTSEGAAWASLNKINALSISAGATVTIRVKTGVYDKVTDLISLSQSATGATVNIVFEPGCENNGAAYTTANSTGSFFDIINDKRAVLYGNGTKVYGWTMGTGNGLGGNGANAACSYDAYDFEIYNCIDGLSCHGGMTANFYDCTVYDCTKAGVAHIGTTNTTHTRCSITEIAGGSASTIIHDGATCEFFDSIILPGNARNLGGTGPVEYTRSHIGNASTRAQLSGAGAQTFIDSYVNFAFDTQLPVSLTGCYGKISARQRNGGSLTMENCVISGPASGLTNIFYSNFNPGSGSPHIIRNNIFETASAAAFMSYDATNAGYLVAAGSEFFNNILSGSAAFDADLITADTGGTVIVDNVTADALIGAANTTDPADYGYAAGSPAIGAGTSGSNSGFAVGDVAAMTAQQVRGPDGLPGYHAEASGTARPTYEAGANPSVNHDGVDDQLVATLPDLGTDATVAYVNSAGVTILTAQTISGATNLPTGTKQGPIIYIDRALTAGETTSITNWLTVRQPT